MILGFIIGDPMVDPIFFLSDNSVDPIFLVISFFLTYCPSIILILIGKYAKYLEEGKNQY